VRARKRTATLKERNYLRGKSNYLRTNSNYLRGKSGYLRDSRDPINPFWGCK
jgi:hypothetical protein